MRKPGFYWLMIAGRWKPAEWIGAGFSEGGGYWLLLGNDEPFYDREFETKDIGESIEPPKCPDL